MTFFTRRLRAFTALAGAMLALAGCDSSSDGVQQPPAPPPPPPVDTNPPQISAPGALGASSVGDVFVTDAAGLTLYTFENDRNDADGDGRGDSDCNNGCLDNWPPLLADATSVADGQFSIITRDDGTSLQWTFKGLPLYRFAGDSAGGDVNGEGNGGVWYVARPDPFGRADVDDTAKGTIVVGNGNVADVDGLGGRAGDRRERSGFTLYTFENDRNDTDGDGPADSDCNDGCAEVWPPLFADPGATEAGAYTIIDRDDGTRQWALNGLPLYFYAPDQAAGETRGEGAGGVWYVARPAPLAVTDSSVAPLLAGATSSLGVDATGGRSTDRVDFTGFTLYVFDNDAADTDGDGVGDSDCNGNCAVTWPPLFADAGAAPTGSFSIVDRDDGTRQWAINGEPLYYFVNDVAAGDVNGDEIGGVWHIARPAPLQVVTDVGFGPIFEARGAIADVDGTGDRAQTFSDRTGFTLYRFDNDRQDVDGDGAGDSDCNGGCAVTWPPLYAEEGDKPFGDFGIIGREDGSRQWTYQGDPLYFFSGDASTADVNGVYGAWFTVSPAETQSSASDNPY